MIKTKTIVTVQDAINVFNEGRPFKLTCSQFGVIVPQCVGMRTKTSRIEYRPYGGSERPCGSLSVTLGEPGLGLYRPHGFWTRDKAPAELVTIFEQLESQFDKVSKQHAIDLQKNDAEMHEMYIYYMKLQAYFNSKL